MLDQNLVLKSDELYLAGSISGDQSGERANGLYLRDTRHLSRFIIQLNQHRLQRLSAHTHNPTSATITLANPPLQTVDGDTLLPHTVSVRQQVRLGTAMEDVFSIQNYGRIELKLLLTIEAAADFRDLFDIRGFPRHHRGRMLRPRIEPSEVVLGYEGLDGAVAETAFTFDQPYTVHMLRSESLPHDELVPILPGFDVIKWEPAPTELPGVQIRFSITLPPGAEWMMRATVTPRPAGSRPVVAVPLVQGQSLDHQPDVTTDNPFFDLLLLRSTMDLTALQTSFPEGTLPAAGIPWFVAPFGRDSIITSLQTLHRSPLRAIGTLRVLATLQGDKIDPARAEQPGKILHELRYGEMARLCEVPHTPYYGSVDATPLFVMLFAETVAWTANESLYRELLPNARRALDWIEQYGDLDGDGLVEYRANGEEVGHIRHQVWKDSFDSLNHLDGTPVVGDIAAVEVQGYVYRAYVRLAEVTRHFGDAEWASDLETKAETLRQRVENAFWLEAEGFYAQALDGEKAPVRTVSSNPGHLLFCGLPSDERAELVARRLLEPDMASGWGIRTLSAIARTYNPMSYHNGSVWPHDNSLIGAGLYRYGFFTSAKAITTALFDAARTEPLYRLPELYCGFPRRATLEDAPVAYPVSCSPQAWAAGSAPLLVRSMLGLDVDLAADRLIVDPALPAWLGSITLRNMEVLGRQVSLSFRREGRDYAIDASEPVIRASVHYPVVSS
jgi:glycogen debranching enzyme